MTLLAVVLALTVAACGGDDSDTSSAAGGDSGGTTSLSVGIATPSVVSLYPIYVAQEEGFFAEEGLDVETVITDDTSATSQALVTGNIDLTVNATTNELTAAAKTADFEPVFFLQDFHGEIIAVYSPPDSPIRTAADLEGATIGVPTEESIEAIITRGLAASAGLEEGEDFDLLVVPSGPQAAAAIQGGDIDAYAGGPTDVSILESRGVPLEQVVPDEPQPLSFANGYWAPRDLVESDPELLKGFIRALVKGEQYIGGDAQKLVEFTKEVSPEQVTDPEVTLALAEVTFELYKYPLAEKPIDADEFQFWFDSVEESEKVTIPGEPSDYYTNDLLPQG